MKLIGLLPLALLTTLALAAPDPKKNGPNRDWCGQTERYSSSDYYDTALKTTLLLLMVILLDLLDWALEKVDELREHPFWDDVIAWVTP
ncbi:hypothetical protein ATEIFO6365_0008043800 [Aspergillus terreus]|uniref:Uncharacterized protein n=1 Tax=Aspergillus terreus TaxID=33178 RepID=A0A5M3Z854_ASPTE|nr:hypothetical protein ATETN484_0010044700 [Aspergillus terreus]GFF18494.1 hypothetical protein ATEIFO6365_0008043800 [Aspergillus terreus]